VRAAGEPALMLWLLIKVAGRERTRWSRIDVESDAGGSLTAKSVEYRLTCC
jgi:hypothetical protein